MMADYISREAALESAWHNYYPSIDHYCISVKCATRKDLEAIPAADVRPVVRGTWEIADSYAGPGLINLRCSVCGAFGGTWKDNTIPSMLSKFCHECGADMRKEKTDEK